LRSPSPSDLAESAKMSGNANIRLMRNHRRLVLMTIPPLDKVVCYARLVLCLIKTDNWLFFVCWGRVTCRSIVSWLRTDGNGTTRGCCFQHEVLHETLALNLVSVRKEGKTAARVSACRPYVSSKFFLIHKSTGNPPLITTTNFGCPILPRFCGRVGSNHLSPDTSGLASRGPVEALRLSLARCFCFVSGHGFSRAIRSPVRRIVPLCRRPERRRSRSRVPQVPLLGPGIHLSE
jgi:hypothetical protein